MIQVSNTALQLYSIREMAEKDFFTTLEEVSKAGYEGVEFAGYYNTPAKELKAALDDNGLKAAGSHVGINLLENDLEKAIEYSLEINNPYIICPALPGNMIESVDACKRTGQLFNKIGERCKDSGIKFGYHNHGFEFNKHNDDYIFDLLAKYTEPDLMFFELDTYWVEYMDISAEEILKKYGKRCTLLHIKDMNNRTEKKNTEVGTGVIDFNRIIKMGKEIGVDWYIVEQEEFVIPEIQSIKVSCENIKNMIANI